MYMKSFFAVCAMGLVMLASCSSGKTECQNTNTTVVDKAKVVYENIMTRRSIRQYKPEAVERSKMDTIIQCGINAPNGMNRQAYEVRIVDSKEFLDGVTEAYKKANPEVAEKPSFKNAFCNAPTVAFIAADKNYDLSHVDCGLLGGNMVLSAWSMGVGSCCLGGIVRFMLEDENARPYLEKLDFSEDYELIYAIGFGYPDESPAAKPRKTDKVRYID